MARTCGAASGLALLLLAACAAAQPNQAIPAAADTAGGLGEGKPVALDFQQLEKCTADSGLSSHLESCTGQATLSKPGQGHWYRFNVLEDDSAFTLHFLLRVLNGRVRMGVWFPGQSLESPPSVDSTILLSSTFAQEQYITIPAVQLFHQPGIYMLQILNEYGAPHYSLRADVTPATTLLAEEDRAALGEVVQDCCSGENGMVCHMLVRGLTSDNIDDDLCHTEAVQCDKDGHITDLVLQGSNSDSDLTCPKFSKGFAKLEQLNRLDLAGANLGAELPAIATALAPAKRLRWLVLRTAGVLGGLSCDIILPNLHLLSLTRNGITGPIPECFTRSTTLTQLYLSDNSLTGPLPDFSPDSALQLLFLRDQFYNGKPSLDGKLPASLSKAANLQYLQLSGNALTGGLVPLPAYIRYFNVSGNQLEGELVPLPQSLVSLDISANRLRGKLPADMSGLTNLVDMQAYFNEFEGPLPAKLPQGLVQLAVAGNRLTGGVPALPRGIKYLSVAENQLEGQLPDGPGASGLWFADLSSNKFTGAVPASFSQSADLVYLNVSHNKLGSIAAAEAWSTPSLITLDASDNQIAGPFVSELSAQPFLAYINLSGNKLNGTLDKFAEGLKPDGYVGAVFDVSSNQLSGELPKGLGHLAAFSTAPAAFPSWNELDATGYPVKVFSVANNKLSGPFPSFITESLTGLVSQQCSQDFGGACNFWVDIDGGDNKFACPPRAAAGASQPEDLSLLKKQELGCEQGGATYEVSSVLAGSPVKVDGAAKAASRPVAQAAEQADDAGALAHGGAGAPVAAAPAPASGGARGALPPAAIAGIVAGAVAVCALVAALGYVVVYRRWYTVRTANSFKKMNEGPLAATGGATVSSSAPGAGLPSLAAPQPAIGDVLSADNHV